MFINQFIAKDASDIILHLKKIISKHMKLVKVVFFAVVPSVFSKDIWLMNSTWGQQRHFHKSFYGCHQLDRT